MVTTVLLKLLYESDRLTVAWVVSPLIASGMLMLRTAVGGGVN